MIQVLMLLVVAVFGAAFIVELMWLGWAVSVMLDTAPIWISAAVVASHLMVCFGFAAMYDRFRKPAPLLQP